MLRALAVLPLVACISCSGNEKKEDAGPNDLAGRDGSVQDLSKSDRGSADRSRDIQVKPDLVVGPPSAWKEMKIPQSTPINAVWGLGPDKVWAVGKGGLILRYDGKSWSQMNSPVKDDLYAIWGYSENHLYAAGDAGVILRYQGVGVSDAGVPAGWSKESITSSSAFRGVFGTTTHVYAVGPAGTMRYRTLTSSYWSSVYFSTSGKDFNAIWGVGADLYVVGNDGLILKCTASCTSSSGWTAATTDYKSHLRAIWGSSPTSIYVVGFDGEVLFFNGTKWGEVNVGTQSYLYGVWGSTANDVYVVGYPVFKADESIHHYDGASWSKMAPSKPSLNMNAVWGSSATDVFAVGNAGILHFDGTKP